MTNLRRSYFGARTGPAAGCCSGWPEPQSSTAGRSESVRSDSPVSVNAQANDAPAGASANLACLQRRFDTTGVLRHILRGLALHHEWH